MSAFLRLAERTLTSLRILPYAATNLPTSWEGFALLLLYFKSPCPGLEVLVTGDSIELDNIVLGRHIFKKSKLRIN